MSDLFLSYAREDRVFAERLAGALQGAGFSVWWDREVAAGESFAQVIEAALREARGVVALWSRASVGSLWVQAEANDGLERRILIPARIDECVPPLVFRTVQTAELVGWTGDPQDPRFERFVADIRRLLPTPDGEGRPPRVEPATGVAAAELVAHSVALLREVLKVAPEERGIYWWRLLELGDRADRLERSVLLALEALRRDPSDDAKDALARALGFLTRPILELPCAGGTWSAAWLPDGSGVAVALPEGGIEVWDLATGKFRNRHFEDRLFSAVVSCPEGLVLWGGDGAVWVWDPKTGGDSNRWGPVSGRPAAFDPAGRYAVIPAATADGEVRVVNADSGETASAVRAEGPVAAVAISADGVRLALAGKDGRIGVRRLPEGTPETRLRPGARVEALAFGPDGQRLAAACTDGTARVWLGGADPEDFRLGHGDRVIWVTFSPDEALLASASQDGTARVWDLGAGREVARLNHRDNVNGAHFSPDGRHLVTASQERLARVWRIAYDDPAAEACSRLSRNLSPEEWRQYLGAAPYRETCPELS